MSHGPASSRLKSLWREGPGPVLKWLPVVLALGGAIALAKAGRYVSRDAHASELQKLETDFKAADLASEQRLLHQLEKLEERTDKQFDRMAKIARGQGDPGAPPKAFQRAER